MPRAFLGLALTVLLAIGMTIGGMIPNLMRGPGGGDSATGNPPAGQPPGMPGDGPNNLPDASAGDLAEQQRFPRRHPLARDQAHPDLDRAHAADCRMAAALR